MARAAKFGGIEFAVSPGAAALAVAGPGGVSFVSGGRALRLSLKPEGERCAVVLEDPAAQSSVTLAEGGAVEASEAFAAISRRILESGRPRRRRRVAALAAALAAGLLLGTFLSGGTGGGSPSPQDELIRELLAKPGDTPEPGTPRGALDSLGKGTAVLPTPDFLAVPDELPTLPEDALAATGSRPVPPRPVAPQASPAAEAPTAAPAEVAPTPEAAQAPVAEAVPAGQSPAELAAAAALRGPAPEVPATDADAPTADADTRADPAPVAPPVASAPTPEATAAAGSPAPVPAHDAATKAEAEKVVGSMVKGGMTSEDAMKILANLQELAGEDGRITPEMLSTLPHEVAKVLVDSGAVEQVDGPADANGTPHRIIRLSDEVMAAHVGRDGIPNIPHQNSWASTGNTVSLPLPGGGDVKGPADLEAFGLKP